ncbi:urease accessory protein [Amycolatopsis bartoniae]|uniref:Urease accessory protein UreF n=1 Tax=Amycolatopsis bartoniae TaxID=941986 RepID=A0A8H9MCE9_9PSEU|nr:urease accessory UreF family protein [Amycolatopsis bartoniae]MBB2934921.1 urease accessory protein [Amycolatopsis bartoniae]TVS99555.1 urease accessory protein UreF [Amycolatopsis bartoniae]GHF43823.1 urease accessory protein UreF [Amycolatopsis bartoniae]
MDVTALLLADSRFPGGGHVHSGGLEEVVARKLVTTERDLPPFLHSRLWTAGLLAAAFGAASAHAVRRNVASGHWLRLDAELDARTPSHAQREASRAQGRGTARAGRIAWPAVGKLLAVTPRPHHPIITGALAGAGGAAPRDTALTLAYLAVSGPASAAVRLLGFDPLTVNALVVRLAPQLEAVADEAAATAGADPADLPAPSAPALDLLAEAHLRHHEEEVRLFAS